MLKRFSLFLVLVLLIPFHAYGYSYIGDSAYSSVAIDGESGRILYENNSYMTLPMASTTKVMTCLLACESDKLGEVVTITHEMIDNMEGSSIYVAVGDRITLYDLVKGAMISSGNDAANAIAVYLSGSVDRFVRLMNKRADEIGATSTEFVTPSGLDKDNHHSTAYDMALIAAEAMKNSVFAEICKLKSTSITINNKKQTLYNHNKLLSYNENFVGVKTGFTTKAGRCLISAYDYEGNKIITVTLNAPDDWQDHKNIVEYCKSKYAEYDRHNVYTLDVVGGEKASVMCLAHYKVYSLDGISTHAYYYPFIYAPVEAGEVVGKLKIYSNEKLISTVDIIVKDGIKQWQTQTK